MFENYSIPSISCKSGWIDDNISLVSVPVRKSKTRVIQRKRVLPELDPEVEEVLLEGELEDDRNEEVDISWPTYGHD